MADSGRLDLAGRSLLCPVLVERESELAALATVLDRLPDAGGVTVVVGEAGVGKTRLVREVLGSTAPRGVTVLSGRAVPGATPVPYRPLTEAFLAAFRSSPPPRARELEGFAGQVGRLLPEWRDETPGGAIESPVLLGEAVIRLLGVIGGDSGCVLLLEDLHWADAETLAVVEYLADALPREGSVCLCTARPEGAAVDVLARVRRHPDVSVVGLERLGRLGIERAVAACLGVDDAPVAVVESIASNSEGNPFLIEELLAGLVASDAVRFEDGNWTTTGRLSPSVPFDFGESVCRRMSDFGADARAVLRAAALLGRQFDWDLLPGLADVDGRAAVDALRVAVDEQLVEADGEAFRFRHALTREAVLRELLPHERRALAERALPAVEGAHPGLPGVWCEMAAGLAEEAGLLETAARHRVECARRALRTGALASAETIALRARSLAPEAVDDADDVLVQALALAGKPEQAAVVGDALVERLSRRQGDVDRLADVLVVLARAALAAGNADRARALVDRARSLDDAIDDAHAARFDAVGAHVALDQARVEDARALALAAVDRAQSTGQPAVECEALEVLGRVDRSCGDTRDAVAWFGQSASVAHHHGLTTWEVRARHEAALMSAYVDGDLEPLHDARALAASTGALVSVAVMDLTLAEGALGGFDRDGCIESAQRCVDASRRYGLATLPVAYLWLAGGYALADDLAAMEGACDGALDSDPDDPRILGDLWGRVRAMSSMVRDDVDELRRDIDTMMTYVRVAPITTSIYPSRIFWSLLHTIDDDDHGAAARAEVESATHLRSWPTFTIANKGVAAVAAGRDGRTDEATARYAAAMSGLSHGWRDGPVQYFQVLAAEAAIRDGWGDPVTMLRRAEAFFDDRGYDKIVRRCRRLLAEAGAPLSRRGRGDSAVPERLRALGVTSREVDVLKLVADGLTNREVAHQLFLSPKTVERHLSSLFDRTNRRSRQALADLWRELSG